MEVATSAVHLEYFAGLAGSIEGSCQDLGPRFNFTRREPFGVVGQIVPWNTPLKLMPGDLRLPWLAATRWSSSRRSLLH
jgi:acyl-CoA reductase-like NAD-dependent aldehyde dehydrogenase